MIIIILCRAGGRPGAQGSWAFIASEGEMAACAGACVPDAGMHLGTVGFGIQSVWIT